MIETKRNDTQIQTHIIRTNVQIQNGVIYML